MKLRFIKWLLECSFQLNFSAPVVKSDSAGPIKDKQALIDDDDDMTMANGTSPANQFEIMEPSSTLPRRGSTSQVNFPKKNNII